MDGHELRQAMSKKYFDSNRYNMRVEKKIRLDVELIRVVSASGIVWYHSNVDVGHDIAYAGLVCFVILSAFFATISKNNKDQMFARLHRLLAPWIIWSLFYALLNIVRYGDVYPTNYNIVNALLATPSIHLWYIPFIILGTLVVSIAKKYLSKNEIGILSGVISLALMATAPEWRRIVYVPPWGQYLHALPALLIGFFFGCYKDINAMIRSVLSFSFFLIITIMALKGVNGFGTTYLFGFIPCLLLLKNGLMIDKSHLIIKFSKATFGVYLSHIFILTIINYFKLAGGVVLPILSIIISFIAIITARQYLPNAVVKYAL